MISLVRAGGPSPGRGVRLDPTVAVDAEEAAAAIVRFDAEVGSRMVPFSSILLRSEPTASSRIERLTATAKATALAELGDTSEKNATMIVSNVKSMQAAIAMSDDLSEASILAMHTALLEEDHPEWAGPDEWLSRIQRGLVRISTVTLLEIGFSTRNGADHRGGHDLPVTGPVPVRIIRVLVRGARRVDPAGQPVPRS